MISEYALKTIKVSDIDSGDRAREQYGDLEGLLLSIKTHGLIHPIAVLDKSKVGNIEEVYSKELDPSKPYLLLAGGRRYHAHRLGDLSDIDAKIYEQELNEKEIKAIELYENLHRKELTWQEETNLKKQIHDLHVEMYGEKIARTKNAPGHSMKDTADILNESTSNTSRDIQLARAMETIPELGQAKSKSDALKMFEKIQKTYETDKHAKALASKLSKTPKDKLHKDLVSNYMVRDFFDMVKTIPDNSVNFCEVDPPYAVDLSKQKKNGEISTAEYNEIDKGEYPEFMKNVFKECYRVMSEHSWMVVWFGPAPWFSLMKKWIRDAGFHVRGIPGIWYKGHGQTHQPAYYLANSYEMFFYCRKGKPTIMNQGRSNVFEFPPVPGSRKRHPTERPVEMIQEVLSTFCHTGSRVMVPFLGSGNTLLAASNLGYSAFGTDLTKSYKDSFTVAVYEDSPPNYHSYSPKESD